MKNNKRKIGILGVMLASSALMLASCQFNQTEEKPYSIGENGFITLDHASGISENGELNLDKIDGYTISAVADEAYKGSTDLKSVTLSNNIVSLGRKCFADCDNLVSLFIPSTIQYIADDAFDGCDNLYIKTDLSYSEWKNVYKGNDVKDDHVTCKSYDVYLNDCFYSEVAYGNQFHVSAIQSKGYSVSIWEVIEESTGAVKKYNVDENYGLSIDFKFHSDINVVPVYIGNTHTISFKDDIDNEVGSQTVQYRESMSKIDVPSRTGYRFLGYYYTDPEIERETCFFDASGYPTTVYPFDYCITVKAKWKANEYLVSLNTNGGHLDGRQEYSFTYNQNYSLPTPRKAGYQFLYWCHNGQKVESFGYYWEFAEDIQLDAFYKAIQSKVTLHFNGGVIDGSGLSTLTMTYDMKYTLPNMKKTGYDFKYWQDEYGRSYALNGYWENTDVTSLSAYYTPKKYQLILMSDGSQYSTRTVTYDSDYWLPSPSKTGYTFSGWYFDKGFTDSVSSSGYWQHDTDDENNTITLYAKFIPNEYVINFHNVKASEMPDGKTSMTVTYDAAYSLPTPTRTGYVFNGWKSYYGDQYENSSVYKTASNLDLYADFTAKEYKALLHNGTDVTEVALGNYGDSYSLSAPDSIASGYSFDGWYKDETYEEDKKVSSSGIWNIDSDTKSGNYYTVDLYAKLKGNEYKIYLHGIPNGFIEGDEEISVTYNEHYTIPNVKTNEYFTFDGWYTDESYNTPYVSSKNYSVVGDLNLYAKITSLAVHTLTFKANGGTFEDGTDTSVVTANYGKPITAPVPSYTGYEFVSWTKEGTDEVVEIPSISDFTSDLTLVANWRKKTASYVTFSTSYGTAPSSMRIEKGSTYTLPSVTDSGDKKFIGWYCNGTQIPSTGVWDRNDDITLTAEFRSISVTYSKPSSANYGFNLNSSTGYYVSTNRHVDSSYAYCEVTFTSNASFNLKVQYISYGENNYDYGIFSNLDTRLSYSSSNDSINVKKSCKGSSSSSAYTLNYGTVSAGTHFITIKYIKDGSVHEGSDTLQFKIILE